MTKSGYFKKRLHVDLTAGTSQRTEIADEFIDRYGPRLAHLNGLLQVLCQLGSTPTPTTPSTP